MNSGKLAPLVGSEFWWLWWRFSARRVVRNPLRVAFVLLSVALATTLWSAVARVSLAGIDSFEQGISGGERPYHLMISPVGGRLKPAGINACLSSLSPISEMVGVRREAGLIRVGERQPQVARVVGVTLWGEFGDAKAGSEAIASRGFFAQISPEQQQVTLSVAGIERSIELSQGEEGNSLLSDSDLIVPMAWLPGEVVFDSIAIRLAGADRGQEGAKLAALEWLKGCFANDVALRAELISAPIERGEQLLGAYRLNVAIMAGITLLVCALLVSQATRLSLRNLGRDLSILRSLGVAQRWCFLFILGEAAVVSALGALAGITIGYPLVLRLSSFLSSTASEIYNVSLASSGIAGSISYGLLIWIGMIALGVAAAALGGREALRIEPYRGARREQVHYSPILAHVALKLALISIAVCALALLGVIVRPRVGLAYLALVALISLAAMVVPMVLIIVSRVLTRLARGGVLALRLASASLVASGRVFILSVTAASVSIALIVGLTLMVESFRGTLRDWIKIRLAGDLFVSATLSGKSNDARIDPALERRVASLSGVSRVVPYYETASEIARVGVVVSATPISEQCKRGIYLFAQGECLKSGELWRSKALISEGAARKLGAKIGAKLLLDERQFEVVGVIKEFSTERPLILIDQIDFLNIYTGHRPQSLTIDLNDTVELNKKGEVESIKGAIERLAPDLLVVRNQAQLSELVETLFNRTFRVTDSVRWIVFAMAILGLLATVAQQLWERRRELRVASVLGVSLPTLAGAAVLELVACAMVAITIGLLVGVGLGWCLIEFINPLVFGWSLSFELSGLIFTQALLFIATLIGVGYLVVSAFLRVVVSNTRLADE